MNNTKKSRVFVIIVAILMLGSTAGYAVFSPTNTGQAQNTGTEQTIELVNQRVLTGQEVIAVLNAGRVLIEYSHPVDCEECAGELETINQFALNFQNFVIISEFAGTEKELDMTSGTGKTVTLEGEITKESLTGLFCSIAIAQPRECVLRDIGNSSVANATIA